ncbi:hypothetical protein PybrP1_011133 [[Pythium] brassicae (nom. inval.)]|nr:hypothetical protein PybrP1_011133 [[Pythium] brassicae (nom. inval.)]
MATRCKLQRYRLANFPLVGARSFEKNAPFGSGESLRSMVCATCSCALPVVCMWELEAPAVCLHHWLRWPSDHAAAWRGADWRNCSPSGWSRSL